jgi:hypothetical protein
LKGRKESNMYQVIDCARGNVIDSQWDDFDDVLVRAGELAVEQAIEDVEVSTYENGDDPRRGPGNWEAGACPYGDGGGYWPHVEWVD